MDPINGRSIAINYSLQLLENNHAWIFRGSFQIFTNKIQCLGEELIGLGEELIERK